MKMLKMLFSLALVFAFCSQALAQTTTTSTTLSAAIGDTTTRIFPVASATGWSASTSSTQYYYWVDGEYGRVVSISGTNITVARTTNARRHASGATIYFGTSGNQVVSPLLTGGTSNYFTGVFFNGSDPLGPCTSSSNTYLPVINTATSTIWDCNSVTGLWNKIADGSVATARGQFTATFGMAANGSLADQSFFLANRAYRIVAIREVHSTAGSDAGAVTIHVEKDTSTTAPGSGTTVMSGTFNAKGTANTVQSATLSTTTADTILAAGDRLSVDFTGTLTALAGVVVSVDLIPVN